MSAADQQKPTPQKQPGSNPGSKQVIRLIATATLSAAFLGLSALTLTGTVAALILATPILVIFSPIFVPAGALLFLIVVGFLFSGASGVAAVAALMWIYNYVAGKHPPGSDQLDYARMKIASAARDIKVKAAEYGHQVQPKGQEDTQQQGS